jgi:hypothetical protein
LPKNGIWFKPAATGNCIIGFMNTQKSSNGYKSIYKITRDGKGNITGIEEDVICFDRNAGNKTVVFFQYKIDADDLGHDFIIGNSSEHPNATMLFYFLALAGAGKKGYDVTTTSKELLQVNFVDEATRAAGGAIAENGMKITTFKIDLTDTPAAFGAVDFSRESMTADAVAVDSGSLTSFGYTHNAIIKDPSSE